jgi:hypothetical protein
MTKALDEAKEALSELKTANKEYSLALDKLTQAVKIGSSTLEGYDLIDLEVIRKAREANDAFDKA